MNTSKNINVKSILNKTRKRDPWFLDDYTLNPYHACSFNCLYCYIRGSKYGESMNQAVKIKANAPELLSKQLSLRASKNEYGFIVLSSATDPYLQIEKETQLTRQLLEIILEYRFPVHIITKSNLVLRDLDLLKEIHENAILPDDLKTRLKGGCLVSFSFATLEDSIARVFESGAPSPSKRLLAIKQIVEFGLPTGISLMPLLPWIADTASELERTFRLFQELKVDYVLPATLTLFGNDKADSKTLVLKAIEKYYPQYLEKYQQYFAQSNEMPTYYQLAFRKKTMELCQKYGLNMRPGNQF